MAKQAIGSTAASSLGARGRLAAYAPWILIVAGVSAYANSFAAPFVFDDIPSIVENSGIRKLWPLWHLIHYTGEADIGIAGRPVPNVSFALNYAFGGLEVAGYHAVNLAIHLATALLLFGLVRRTLQRPVVAMRAGVADAVGFAAALVWLVHPLQTKAVTFVVQRIESLAALFFVLAIYALLRDATEAQPKKRWKRIAVLAAVCGMATKESCAGLPIAALLFDATFLADGWRDALKRRGKLHAALAASWIVLVVLTLSTPRFRSVSAQSAGLLGPFDYLTTQSWVLAHYARLAFWPSPLIFDYGMSGDGVEILTEPPRYLPYFVPLCALGLLTLRGAIRRRPWAFPVAVAFLVLGPTSSVLPIRVDVVAEHRVYLPIATLAILAFAALARLLARSDRAEVVLVAVALVLAAPLALATHARNRDYASHRALWADTVEKNPGSARALTNLGLVLYAENDFDGAIELHRRAVERSPDYAEAHHNLATALMQKGDAAGAVVEYRRTLELTPDAWATHLGLAEALLALGDHPAAASAFTAALQRNPSLPQAHVRLGALEHARGRTAEAIAHFEQALRWMPNDAQLLNSLGMFSGDQGRFDRAALYFQRAVAADPSNADARANLERLRALAPR